MSLRILRTTRLSIWPLTVCVLAGVLALGNMAALTRPAMTSLLRLALTSSQNTEEEEARSEVGASATLDAASRRSKDAKRHRLPQKLQCRFSAFRSGRLSPNQGYARLNAPLSERERLNGVGSFLRC